MCLLLQEQVGNVRFYIGWQQAVCEAVCALLLSRVDMVLHGLVSRLIGKEFSFLVLWKNKRGSGGCMVRYCDVVRCVLGREDRVSSLLILLSLRSPSFCLAIILASCVYSVLTFPITLLGYYE